MAKYILLFCLMLVSGLSRSAPILDEEVEEVVDDGNDKIVEIDDSDLKSKELDEDDEGANNEGEDDERVNDDGEGDERVNDDGEGDERVNDDGEDDERVNDDGEDDVGDNDEGEDDDGDLEDKNLDEKRYEDNDNINDKESYHDGVNKEAEVTENQPQSDDETEADSRIVDSEGDISLSRKSESFDEHVDDGMQDMGKQISELKKIFDEDMPMEIEKLKSNSKLLKNDLDALNEKLEQFLADYGVKKDPVVAESDGEFGDA